MDDATQDPVRLFCSDLDGTLLGNPEATTRFRSAWESIPPARRPLLVCNSGRLLDAMEDSIGGSRLPRPDYLIAGVGTTIVHGPDRVVLGDFAVHVRAGWDAARVASILAGTHGIRPQPEGFQHELKSSWYLDNASPAQLAAIARRLEEAGLLASIVYSSQRDLDILPRRATKGGALAWLCQHLSIPLHSVLVAGDSGNDASLFRLRGVRGIVVENARPELLEAALECPVFASRQVFADGIVDGLRHFGVVASRPSAHASEIRTGDMTAEFRLLFSGQHFGAVTSQERRFLHEAFHHAVAALRRNITPRGFSACSLDDNTVTGTDANYRSVWARDGAITLINTLDLADPDIRAAQRATLDTLLGAASPRGQFPANVRIDDGEPDYGGVGNICSIDGGLWIIIAVYNWVHHTGDVAFLQHHAPLLARAMDWLAAHDSNNDGLLEVPEAGDWTDLFGRSYNVLYDEVLWYRATVAYGRLREILGDAEGAAVWLRASNHIRGRILETFWPTTQPPPGGSSRPRFADTQLSLGDTQYLIAEVTPFAFNWRCDVLGNVLAFLMNLLDVARARRALRFLWGVGVNQPGPVANLYPVVQAGDPDWRDYYTVNLLNLPHHYHNGGIWPFVGGLWVRFIHRLGFHEVASQELLRLARLNQAGRDHEWEFNEWFHGTTGRPMGKAFQAWSAATFIRACHELEFDPPAS